MTWIANLMLAISHWLESTRLSELTVWMASTPLSTAINQNSWVTPTVESIHILSIAGTFGAALMINLRVLQLAGQSQAIARVEKRYTPWIWWGLLVLLATGVIIVLAEPAREILSGVFWTKMALIASVALVTLGFQTSVRRNPSLWDAGPGGQLALRTGAAAVLAIWCAIILLGRWIAYAGVY
jgi:uncharacterized membrane protein